MDKPAEQVLWDAEFSPKVRAYLVLFSTFIACITCVGIPLLPIIIPVALIWSGKYVKSLKCTLTRRSLKIGKGVLFQIEKTVPLDKITDLGLVSGPILRYFELEMMSVETAGQSAQGPLVSLIGVVDGRAFRDKVLEQRDRVVASQEDADGRQAGAAVSVGASTGGGSGEQLLTEIRDTLVRIEQRMGERES